MNFSHLRNGTVEFLYNQKNISFPGVFGGYYSCEDGNLKIKYCPYNAFNSLTAWNGSHCTHETYLSANEELNFNWEIDTKVQV